MTELVPTLAGAVSTTIFATSFLPMLLRAFRTKDLKSYSLSSITLTNAGNVIHSVYVYSLPPGPIWVLHGFYLISAGFMLLWYLQYELRRSTTTRESALRPASPDPSDSEPSTFKIGNLRIQSKRLTTCSAW